MKTQLLLSLFISVTVQGASIPETVEFNRDVRSIISDRCFKCHGPDEATQEAGLRLDTFAGATALLKGEQSKHAIVPGNPDESELVYRITTDDVDDVMPPADSELKLSQREKDILIRWVEQGAKFQQHWAFEPVVRRELPGVSNPDWCKNGIDHFILNRLDREGLKPSPPAEKMALLKRVTFDLTGLPPTPEEIDMFLEDRSPKAFEKVVDRLLASPRYGERMALTWVEASRYADTSGYQADWERFMWPWREWVIKAYNRNVPFDQFTIEQLAGDLLKNPTQDQLVATAFNRNHRINDEGGVIAAEFAVEYVVDRVDTTSTIWMGLTMGCARCHDHKYDPLSQKDFYQLFSFFNNVPENGKDGRKGYANPVIDYPHPERMAKYKAAQAQLKKMEADFKADRDEVAKGRKAWVDGLRKKWKSRGSDSDWRLFDEVEVQAGKGLIYKQQDDASWLAQKPAVNQPEVDIKGSLPNGKVTAIRLESLTDPSFSGQGNGPSSNGNFVLTAFEVSYRDAATAEDVPVKFVRAMADYSQDKWPVANAIDGKPTTGWAIMADGKKYNRTAVFVLETPVDNHPENEWKIRLRHDAKFAGHYVGRFRISATGQVEPSVNDGKLKLPGKVRNAILADKPNAAQKRLIADHYRNHHPSMTRTRKAIEDKRKAVAKLKAEAHVKVMVMSEMPNPRQTYVLDRGLYDQADKERPVQSEVPEVLGLLPEDLPRNRLGLASWLVSGEHPLTGRVTVNRYWQNYFGVGLVKTAEDFGAQGELPSHPELLDWLAAEFVRLKWDVKAMQKLIVMSASYQQSSKVSGGLLERDPENRLIARGPRFRLSGYEIRDQALAVSGLLVNKIGGASVKPYQPPGLWSEVSFQSKGRSTDFFVQDKGDKLYRRSLYTFWKRSVAPPQMATFDAAGREACSVSLIRTSTPLQALTLMNDTTFLEAARHMAARMLGRKSDRLAYGLKLASIDADNELLGILDRGLRDYRAIFSANPEDAKVFVSIGESPSHSEFEPVEYAAYTAVASVILNLDQTITKE